MGVGGLTIVPAFSAPTPLAIPSPLGGNFTWPFCFSGFSLLVFA